VYHPLNAEKGDSTMSQQPKVGDRVRLRTRDFEPDYRTGDTGKVESGPHPIPSGGYYYVVTLDRGEPGATGIILNASEIEVDAASLVSR
jgi:hypothetical protein